MGNGPVQSVKVEESIWHKWVKFVSDSLAFKPQINLQQLNFPLGYIDIQIVSKMAYF